MKNRILVFYGSYRFDRLGIRLADYVVAGLCGRGEDAELIDAKAIGLPMLKRMYKEYAPDAASDIMEALAGMIRASDAFVFITAEYNWGRQPGLKNLSDHFLEEWFWRPAGIASYPANRLAGIQAWHGILAEMGMTVISSTLAVGSIADTLTPDGKPLGEAGGSLDRAFSRFADDLIWWTEAARS
jgi:NAD(P)H-dependent FMN reductase